MADASCAMSPNPCAYEVWWALVLGFAISAIVQAWVPRAHDAPRRH
jgi:hypothetical protein